MDIDRNERAARNQALFREVNERVVELLQGGFHPVEGDGSRLEILCECANASCHERIHLTAEEYQAARASTFTYPIKPGHEWPDVERIVSEHDGYVVVEKVGETAEISVQLGFAEPQPGESE